MMKTRIVYEVDLDERHELIQAMFDVDGVEQVVREIRKKSVLVGIAFFVVSLTSAGIVLSIFGQPVLSPSFGLFAVVMLIWAFSFMYRNFTLTGMSMHLSELFANIAKAQGGPGVHGQAYMELQQDALVLGDRFAAGRMEWPCIKRIVQCPTCTLCELTGGSWITIPMRAFDYDEHAYERFVEELKRLNDGEGGWDGIVSRFLSEFRFSCPSCQYELHTSPSAQCPECGHKLETKDFQFDKIERIEDPLDIETMGLRVEELLHADL